jgi:hypothetical protein
VSSSSSLVCWQLQRPNAFLASQVTISKAGRM